MSGGGVLREGWLGGSWEHFPVIGSTNDYLKQNAFLLPHGHVATAALQTAGKGRLGRSWVARDHACLALSFLLRDWPLERLSALPLLVGLGVAVGVEKAAGISASVKWSNDILVKERKLCGVLCESILRENNGSVIVGFGINLLQNQQELEELSLVYATSLYLETKKTYDAQPVAKTVLNELEPMLEQFRLEGFAPFREAYVHRCITVGREVALLYPDREVRGTALDISDTGDLICSIDGQVVPIRAGEVSVRGIYGYV